MYREGNDEETTSESNCQTDDLYIKKLQMHDK